MGGKERNGYDTYISTMEHWKDGRVVNYDKERCKGEGFGGNIRDFIDFKSSKDLCDHSV